MAVKIANTYFLRLIGLMFNKNPSPLVLVPCKHVHTFFCKVPLDLYYINKEGVVIHKVAGIKPWRLAPYVKNSHMVLEVPVPNDIELGVGQKIYNLGENLWMIKEKIGQ